MLAIFVGILMEQLAAQGRLEVLERRDLDGYPLVLGSYRGRPVLVCRTGLGEARGKGAAEAVFAAYSPSAAISLRMASSVPNQVGVGDLVFCRRSYLCRDGEPPSGPSPEADRRLLALAQQAASRGRLRHTLSDALTVARVAARPVDRELVRSKYDVAVVDTEGYWLVLAARAQGVPFLPVRSALGRSFDRLPEILDLTAQRGVLSPRRMALHLLRRPARLPALALLAVSVRRATRRLSAFMGEFLREWSMEP